MESKYKGLQFTTRFWLQRKLKAFIKELDYKIEEVKGFDRLDLNEKAEIVEWKEKYIAKTKLKLAVCYDEIITDMAFEDAQIERLQGCTKSFTEELLEENK